MIVLTVKLNKQCGLFFCLFLQAKGHCHQWSQWSSWTRTTKWKWLLGALVGQRSPLPLLQWVPGALSHDCPLSVQCITSPLSLQTHCCTVQYMTFTLYFTAFGLHTVLHLCRWPSHHISSLHVTLPLTLTLYLLHMTLTLYFITAYDLHTVFHHCSVPQ